MDDITIKEVHDIMENELRCVQRTSVNGCDKECDKCPISTDIDKLVKAYGYVIRMIENDTEYIIQSQKNAVFERLFTKYGYF